jgi:hypothetical protein
VFHDPCVVHYSAPPSFPVKQAPLPLRHRFKDYSGNQHRPDDKRPGSEPYQYQAEIIICRDEELHRLVLSLAWLTKVAREDR